MPDSDPSAPSATSRSVPAWPACRPARPVETLASILLDVLAIAVPLYTGLRLHVPALLRLALIAAAATILVAQGMAHCLRGRGCGGLLLGLRTVDDDAGLPAGHPRAILAVLRLGRGCGATVFNIRRGRDPVRGTLADLEETPAAASPSSPASPPTASPRPSRRGAAQAAGKRRVRPEPADGPAMARTTPPSPAPAAPPAYLPPRAVSAPPSARTARSTARTDPDAPSIPPGPPRQAPPPPPPPPSIRPERWQKKVHTRPGQGAWTPASGTASPPESRARRAHALPGLVLEGPGGWNTLITTTTVVGRDPSPQPELRALDTIALPDLARTAAPDHAVIRPTAAGAEITDLGSATGTSVITLGGQRIACRSGEPLSQTPPFTLILGGLHLAVTTER